LIKSAASDRKIDRGKPDAVSKGDQYQLDPNIEIHLYISDSPCGDASIYRTPTTFLTCETRKTTNKGGILYTGAKIIVSDETKVNAADCGGENQLLPNKTNSNFKSGNRRSEFLGVSTAGPVVAREEVQALGKLRIKSGRSNLPPHMRSHSHSCSDKIVLWSVLGLQGAMLTNFLNPPIIPLTSVVVSVDSRLSIKDNGNCDELGNNFHQQKMALERAITSRARKRVGIF